MAQATFLQDQCALTIDGSPLKAALMRDLLSVRVELGLNLPALCLLRVQDDDLQWVDGREFEVGRELRVEMGTGRRLKPVFEGEIVGLGLDQTPAGAMVLVVKAYDRSHRLHRGQKTRVFVQMTDSDIARKIAQEADLRPDVEATSEVHAYLIQDNLTDYEFLRQRAERIGFSFWVEKGILHFRKAARREEEPVRLEWGRTLQAFRPTMSAAQQVSEVVVRGWDVRGKQAIVGRAQRSTEEAQVGQQKDGGETASQAFGQASAVVVHRPVRTQSEAEALAQSIRDRVGHAFIQAEGRTTGTPELAPGRLVEIRGVGQRFSGTYRLTEVVHTISNRAPYRTFFVARGAQAETLLDRLAPSRPGLQGVFVGVVTNNQDPEGLGRVKVAFPWLDDQAESHWARLVTPMAGAGRGLFFLPEVGDEVLVAFEHGDFNHPYVLGALWNGKDKPPPGADQAVNHSGKVVQRIIRSPSGHTLILNDEAQGGGVTIEDKNGNRIALDAQHNHVHLKAKGNLTLEAGGKIVLKGRQGVEIHAEQGKVDIQGALGLALEATQGQTSLKGSLGIEIQSTAGQVNVRGLMINLN